MSFESAILMISGFQFLKQRSIVNKLPGCYGHSVAFLHGGTCSSLHLFLQPPGSWFCFSSILRLERPLMGQGTGRSTRGWRLEKARLDSLPAYCIEPPPNRLLRC